MLARKSSKGKVLNQYLAFINKEKAKLDKQSKARQEESDSSESASDSEMSVEMIEQDIPNPKKRKSENLKQQVIADNEKSEEERAYLKKVHEHDDETETSTLSEN